MYVPPVFSEPRSEEIRRHILSAPFATIVTTLKGRLFASHAPVLIKSRPGADLVLYGHLARANKQWLSFDGAAEGLIMFLGPHAYVSPTIYGSGEATPTWDYSSLGPGGSTDRQISPALPTWNYVAVHLYGTPRVVSPEENERSMSEMTSWFETEWKMSDLPRDYLLGKMENTVGFEVPITQVEGKVKMGQRQSCTGRELVRAALSDSTGARHAEVAREIERTMRPSGSGCPGNADQP